MATAASIHNTQRLTGILVAIGESIDYQSYFKEELCPHITEQLRILVL